MYEVNDDIIDIIKPRIAVFLTKISNKTYKPILIAVIKIKNIESKVNQINCQYFVLDFFVNANFFQLKAWYPRKFLFI